MQVRGCSSGGAAFFKLYSYHPRSCRGCSGSSNIDVNGVATRIRIQDHCNQNSFICTFQRQTRVSSRFSREIRVSVSISVSKIDLFKSQSQSQSQILTRLSLSLNLNLTNSKSPLIMTLWQNPYLVKSQSQSQFLRDSGVSVSISVLKMGFL